LPRDEDDRADIVEAEISGRTSSLGGEPARDDPADLPLGSSHSVTEIARLTGLPVSTAHRLAGDLAGWNLLRRAADGQYEVAALLRQLAAGVERRPVLEDRVPLAVADLFEATQRRARLGVLDGTGVRYIEQRTRGLPPTGFTTGGNLPAHATALGKYSWRSHPRRRSRVSHAICGGTRRGRARAWTGCAMNCGSSG
jgi:DNA-binding IclR family transcriptional regulator